MRPDIGSHQGRRYDDFSDAPMWPTFIVGLVVALSMLAAWWLT